MTSRQPWVSDTGVGDGILFLHPGGTDSSAMEPLAAHFADHRRILIDRPGHGRSADTDDEWSFAAMADEMAKAIATSHAARVHVVGWSDGAIVGLYLALRHPELVRSLVFGGAVFHHAGWLEGVLDGDPPDFMRDALASLSPDGVEHWPIVVGKAQRLHRREPDLTAADLDDLAVPTLIVVGDDDEVRWEHLIEMLESVADAELAVVPRATHGLIVEKPALLAELINEFHRPDRSNGLAPRRRG